MAVDHPVILFDGVCNFCNSTINFIIKQDKKNVFRFAALQSAAGQQLLNQYHLSSADFDSFILIDHQKVYQKSTAAFKLISYLPWYIKWIKFFRRLPPAFTDAVYTLIAKNRYKWFGRKEQCMVPTPDIKNRFL